MTRRARLPQAAAAAPSVAPRGAGGAPRRVRARRAVGFAAVAVALAFAGLASAAAVVAQAVAPEPSGAARATWRMAAGPASAAAPPSLRSLPSTASPAASRPPPASADPVASGAPVAPVARAADADAHGAAAAPPVLRDDRGARIALAAPPRRIVSLLPSLTEAVCALGGCDRLVGTDRFSDWPARVRTLPKLGGVDDVPLERIVALRPDVVLVGTSARVVERLESLGVTVVVLETRNHADVRRSLGLIAGMLGRPARADEVWDRIERDIDAAAARVPAALRQRRVYFELDATPYAAGAGSFVDETLARLGMANALPAALGRFPKLNPEYVVQLQPDIVMAESRALAAMPGRPGWDALRALQAGRTCGFPAPRFGVLARPGPRLGESAALLADCLVAIGSTGAGGAAR